MITLGSMKKPLLTVVVALAIALAVVPGRVQAIKESDGKAGIVHYGTEVISNPEKTISALLGASPGASVSVNIVFEVIKSCFPHLLSTPEGKARMKAMIPTYDVDIKKPEHAAFFEEHLAEARGIAAQYATYPVDRWRSLFAEVTAQLDEIEGKTVTRPGAAPVATAASTMSLFSPSAAAAPPRMLEA